MVADGIKNVYMTNSKMNLINIVNYAVDPNVSFCENITKDLLHPLLGMSTKILDYHVEKDACHTIASALKEFLG